MDFQERHEEARALVVHSLKVALDNDLYAAALRAYNNLAAFLVKEDRHRDALVQVGRALELADGARVTGTGSCPARRQSLDPDRRRRVGPGRRDRGGAGQLGRPAEKRGRPTPLHRARLCASGHARPCPRASRVAPLGRAGRGHTDAFGLHELQAVLLRAEGDFAAALVAAAGRRGCGRGTLGRRRGQRLDRRGARIRSRRRSGEGRGARRELRAARPGETSPLLVAQAVRFRAKLSSAGG